MLTITEKLWDKVRPKSVKKTGLSKVIRETLKKLPGGKIDKLKGGKDSDAASNQLHTLLKTLQGAKSAVASAKDDPKKEAAKQLDAWIKQTQMCMTAIAQKTVGLTATVGDAAAKMWAPKFKKLHDAVNTIVLGFVNCEKNQGSAEGIKEEAEMEMVRRAGELKEKGWTGTTRQDFVKDGDFKSAMAEWNTQVDKWIKAAKSYETLTKQTHALHRPIDDMNTSMDQVAATGGDSKAFNALKSEVDAFYVQTRTDASRKPDHQFRFIQSTTASGSYRSEAEKGFLNRFQKMKKVDADSYLAEEMAKHGFEEKQLAKALQQAKEWDGKVAKLGVEVNKLFGKTDKNYEADAKRLGALMPQLTTLRDRLVKLDEQFKRGRRNQMVANQLARPANAKYKKVVEQAMQSFEAYAAKATKIVQAVTKLARRSV